MSVLKTQVFILQTAELGLDDLLIDGQQKNLFARRFGRLKFIVTVDWQSGFFAFVTDGCFVHANSSILIALRTAFRQKQLGGNEALSIRRNRYRTFLHSSIDRRK